MDELLVYDHILPFLGLVDQPPLNKHHAAILKKRIHAECVRMSELLRDLEVPSGLWVHPTRFTQIPSGLLIQIVIQKLNIVFQHFVNGSWGRQNDHSFLFHFWSFYETVDLGEFRYADYRATLHNNINVEVLEQTPPFYTAMRNIFSYYNSDIIYTTPEPLDLIFDHQVI